MATWWWAGAGSSDTLRMLWHPEPCPLRTFDRNGANPPSGCANPDTSNKETGTAGLMAYAILVSCRLPEGYWTVFRALRLAARLFQCGTASASRGSAGGLELERPARAEEAWRGVYSTCAIPRWRRRSRWTECF